MSSRPTTKRGQLNWGELHKFETEKGDFFWIKGSAKTKGVKHIQMLTDKEVQTHMWLKYDGIFTQVNQPPVLEDFSYTMENKYICEYREDNAQWSDYTHNALKDTVKYPRLNWALTLTQLQRYVDHYKKSLLWWKAFFNPKSGMNTVNKLFFNLYTLNDEFIIPQVRY